MPDATSLFTTRDPVTGAVLFEFDGHIKADGLDLITHEGPGSVPSPVPVDNVVDWQRASNGSYVASVAGHLDTNITKGYASLRAHMQDSTHGASVVAEIVNNATQSVNWSKNIIDDTGSSDYLQHIGFNGAPCWVVTGTAPYPAVFNVQLRHNNWYTWIFFLTAFQNSAPGIMQATLQVGGTNIFTAERYMNTLNSHMYVIGMVNSQWTGPTGGQGCQLFPFPNIFDANDRWGVVAIG